MPSFKQKVNPSAQIVVPEYAIPKLDGSGVKELWKAQGEKAKADYLASLTPQQRKQYDELEIMARLDGKLTPELKASFGNDPGTWYSNALNYAKTLPAVDLFATTQAAMMDRINSQKNGAGSTPITAPAAPAAAPTTGTNPTLKEITDPKTWTNPATTGVAPIQDSQQPLDKSFLGAGTSWVHNLLGGRKNLIEAPNGNDTNPFQANALSATNMARKASVSNPFDTNRRVSPPRNNWSDFYNYQR